MIIFFVSFAGNMYLIGKVWNKWNESPVIVSFAETSTPVWQVPFPAVTICSETKSKARVFNFTRAIYDNTTDWHE
jgi:amiloride-sensitive sodium channel